MFCEQKNVFLKNVKIYGKLKTPLYIIYILFTTRYYILLKRHIRIMIYYH